MKRTTLIIEVLIAVVVVAEVTLSNGGRKVFEYKLVDVLQDLWFATKTTKCMYVDKLFTYVYDSNIKS